MNRSYIVSLKFSKTKHILCSARINGIHANLLVDTGASSSCIHSALQEHFKLQVKGSPFDAAGANQGKMKATMTKKVPFILDDIKWGSTALCFLI
jgi:predicted aspartyl protease